MRHLVKMLAWGWRNGRRPQLVAVALSIVAYVGTIFVSSWVVWAVWLGAAVFALAWGFGHKRGYQQGMRLITALERARVVAGEHTEGEGQLAVVAPVDEILAGLHAHRESL
jgi:hypothetical protein